MDTTQEDFQTEILDNPKENPQRFSDILVTQIILCIAILTGVFILNIFKPEVSTYIIESFKHYSNMEISDTFKNILTWLYDRV